MPVDAKSSAWQGTTPGIWYYFFNQEDILYGVVGDCDNQEYHYGVPFHQISLYRSYYYQPKDPFNSCKNWTIKYNKYDSITNLNVM